ncbi:cupin [Streptomyces cellulosae]
MLLTKERGVASRGAAGAQGTQPPEAGRRGRGVHDDTDEFFLVLDGEPHISLREPDGERTVLLPRCTVFTVPHGTEHKPYAPSGAALLVFEPTGTPSVGDRHDEIPEHVGSTTGHALGA